MCVSLLFSNQGSQVIWKDYNGTLVYKHAMIVWSILFHDADHLRLIHALIVIYFAAARDPRDVAAGTVTHGSCAMNVHDAGCVSLHELLP
jgi:hypothetical protein